MRVLVTGHSGYIGGVLLPMLIARGHDVVGCDVGFFQDCLYKPEAVKVPNLAIDVRDLEGKLLEGFDAVIHLAGLSNDPLGSFDPRLTYEINQKAAVRLADLSKASGVTRFVFASSCSNYGASSGELLDESAPFNPQTAYGHSKVNAETEICALADNEFAACNLRAGTVYGLAPRIRFDLVVNNLMAYALSEHSIFLKSDGLAFRPLVHVEDVARAYVAAIEADKNRISGASFNVGSSSENYQILEVAKQIERALPDCAIVFSEEANTDFRNYQVNCDKIHRELKAYATMWTLQQGIQELKDSFTDSPVAKSDFEGKRFNRLAHLRGLIECGKLDENLRFKS